MAELSYTLKDVERKPLRKYRKKSKYDPIIDDFLQREAQLSEVTVECKEPNYLRTQLKKRIEARGLGDSISVSVVSGKVYLEKA